MHAKADVLNEQHVKDFTEKVKKMALAVDKMNIYAKVSCGTVRTNELNYHKTCYKQFLNNYNQKIHQNSIRERSSRMR